jgi:general stress protein 26
LDEITSFAEIEAEFQRRVQRTAWATVATVDRKGRPRTRILHPIWEGSTGWIATGRTSHKAKHLAANPHVSISYWDPQHEQIHIDAKAEWADGTDDKRRIWDLYKHTPPPLGYDPAIIWSDGAGSPDYGLLKLTPWRLELWSLSDMITGAQPRIWRP